MKQYQVNKFFTNLTSRQVPSQLNSPTTTAHTKHKKNASSTITNGNKYLVYAKRSSRLLKDSSSRLPLLTTAMKTEYQDTPKTAVVRTRKMSANSTEFRIHQHHRNKTETLLFENNFNFAKQEQQQDLVQFNDPPIEEKQISEQIPNLVESIVKIQLPAQAINESSPKHQIPIEIVKQQPIRIPVLGEMIQFKKIDKTIQSIHRQPLKSKISEIEQFNEKSCHLLRKVNQLLTTHREKQILIELEIKKKKETIPLMDREFTQTLSSMPDEKTPKINEQKFHQKLSTITKKQSKVQNFTAQESESIAPLKSLIDALKEKKEEKKEKKVIEIQQVVKQATKKKLRVSVVFEEDEKQIEFHLPEYMNDVQQQVEQVEVKENKQSNIYSLVSKSMLQNKFASRLVKKFGDRVIKTQEDNDAIENFNSFKASQFTRYYLQNHVLKCLTSKYEFIRGKDTITNFNSGPTFDSYLIQQDTFNDYLSKTSGQLVIDQQSYQVFNIVYDKKGLLRKQIEINYQFYKLIQSHEVYQGDNSILSPSGSQLDLSDLDTQNYFKVNYIYYILNLVSVQDLRQNKLKVIVSTIDDETKNQLLHEELMRFPPIVNLVIINEQDLEQNQLSQINQLESQICKSNQNVIKKLVALKFNNILIGLFEDYFDHEVSRLEKIYVQQCKTMRDLDNRVDYARVKTEQQINLHIPDKPKSRQDSLSGSQQSETKIFNKELNPIIAKGMMLKKHQRSKNLLGSKTTQSQNPLMTSMRNLQVQTGSNLPLQTNTNLTVKKDEPQQIQQQQTQQKGSSRQIQKKPNLVSQQSMDPFSLLFRSMLLQESNQNDKSNIERIFQLIEDHRLQDLKDLLHHDQNIHINTQDSNGNTFLIFAARTGAKDIIQFLLQCGADTSITNNEGITALQMAVTHYQYQAADEINKFNRTLSHKSH